MEKLRQVAGWARRAGAALLRDAWDTWWELSKVMIPLIILTKLLQEAGLVRYLAAALSPLMKLVGLPGSMGLVWATALLTNIYGGIVVFAQLAPGAALTTAQATVLVVIMLTAHAFPVETAIARKAGVRVRAMLVIRTGGALLFGFILNQIYTRGGFLQRPNIILWRAPAGEATLPSWAWGQVVNLAMIFGVIVGLLFVLRVLKKIGVEAFFTRLLEPLLELLGMSKQAAPITIIGMTMGVTYGGGLIIREAQSGRLTQKDIFFSMALMGLCHSLIEDTLVMSTLGAHHSGLVWGRLILTLVTTYLLVRVVLLLPPGALGRFFAREIPPRETENA